MTKFISRVKNNLSRVFHKRKSRTNFHTDVRNFSTDDLTTQPYTENGQTVGFSDSEDLDQYCHASIDDGIGSTSYTLDSSTHSSNHDLSSSVPLSSAFKEQLNLKLQTRPTPDGPHKPASRTRTKSAESGTSMASNDSLIASAKPHADSSIDCKRHVSSPTNASSVLQQKLAVGRSRIRRPPSKTVDCVKSSNMAAVVSTSADLFHIATPTFPSSTPCSNVQMDLIAEEGESMAHKDPVDTSSPSPAHSKSKSKHVHHSVPNVDTHPTYAKRSTTSATTSVHQYSPPPVPSKTYYDFERVKPKSFCSKNESLVNDLTTKPMRPCSMYTPASYKNTIANNFSNIGASNNDDDDDDDNNNLNKPIPRIRTSVLNRKIDESRSSESKVNESRSSEIKVVVDGDKENDAEESETVSVFKRISMFDPSLNMPVQSSKLDAVQRRRKSSEKPCIPNEHRVSRVTDLVKAFETTSN